MSALEHGIYRILLDTYYLNEGKLEKDDAKIMRTHSIRSAEEVEAYSNIVNDFFYVENGYYKNEGADKIINKILDKSEKARVSAQKRWDSQRRKKESMRTHNEGNAEGMLPITHNPIPNTHKKENTNVKNGEALEIFTYWKSVMKKNGSTKATSGRINKIKARLKEGYEIAYIKKAIDGNRKSPHHQGKNDSRTKYNDITLICRSGEKLESFHDMLSNPSSGSAKDFANWDK